MDTLQRIIGVGLGGLLTYVILLITKPGVNGGDPSSGYLIAVVLGAIVAFFWPWVIGLVLVRRARDRRVQREVEKQLADQNKG